MPAAVKSQNIKLVDMVVVLPGMVQWVSRQITKADAGNVTLFAFDAGQELSGTTAPFDALVHLLDGEAEVRISGQSFAVCAGEAIIIPANAPHALKASTKFKMLFDDDPRLIIRAKNIEKLIRKQQSREFRETVC